MSQSSRLAPLFDDLKSQFRTFGEGLQNLDSYVHQELSGIKTKLQVIDRKLEVNSIEHQQLKQMIQDADRNQDTDTE